MDISIPITRTKLIIPRRRGEILSRPRLLEVLEESIDNRLLIVAAPAGYGKTSLLVDFVHQTLQPVCWLSLDELDKDPQRFIAHFIAAMNVTFPDFGKNSMPALQGMSQARLNLDALASLIVNDIVETITEHFIFVLDDYHLVEENQDINYFVNRFLMSIDENCHLIISSRRLLPLADMPLLVARSMVGGLGFEDLAFRPEEIQSLYLQNHRIILNEEEAVSLGKLTEGWITGLVLSTEIRKGRVMTRVQSKHVAGVGLYDYLAQQVLENQSDEIKQFLYRSSLLEEFDVDRCEKVIGVALDITDDWQALMDEVQRNNLFTLPVIEDHIWLRYHHLFRDFLQAQMTRNCPEETQKILLQLCEYYQLDNEWERAYQVCERIGDKEFIARLVERAGQSMITQGRLLTLHDWLGQLPDILVENSPVLLSTRGAVAMMLGDTKAGIRYTSQALEILTSEPNNVVLAHTYVRRSTANRLIGNYPQALEDAENAILISQKDPELGKILANAFHSKGSALYQSGRLNEALEWLNNARTIYQKENYEDGATKVSLDIGTALQYLGRLSTAEQTYREVLTYYQTTGNVVWQANLLNNLGVLHYFVGEYEKALNEFERSIQYARLGGYQRLEAYALTSMGDLFRSVKLVQEAEEVYQKAREIDQQIDDQFLHFYLQYIETELALVRKSIKKANDAIVLASEAAIKAGAPYEIHLCTLMQARISYEEKKYLEALDQSSQAFNFFVDQGHHIEANRCRLMMVVASAGAGQLDLTHTMLDYLDTVVDNPEIHHLLMSEGRILASAVEQFELPEPIHTRFIEVYDQVIEYERTLPSIRKMLRRQSQVVHISPPELTISTFGRIQIKLGDHVITSAEWMSQNARDLLLLLLMHPEGLAKEEIGEIFWPDSTPAELKLRFKNTIYRLRHAAGKDAVKFDGEIYTFNRGMDYEADCENFIQGLAAARRIENISARIKSLRAVIKIYRGTFLPELSDQWVITERERLHQMAMDAMIQLAELQMQQGELEGVLETAQFLLDFEPTHEPMACLAMRALAVSGNIAAVMQLYDQLRDALHEELDATPSLQTIRLYENLTKEHRVIR